MILWNHRWEYDKDPWAFVEGLRILKGQGVPFRLLVLGERFRTVPEPFEHLRSSFRTELEVIEFLPERGRYLAAVERGDLVVSTARHEFFGLGTLEAIRCGLLPVLPDDLAYPELLPEEEHGRFLYPREEGFAPALRRAIEAFSETGWWESREKLVAHTDRFAWSALAPEYDRVFEETLAQA